VFLTPSVLPILYSFPCMCSLSLYHILSYIPYPFCTPYPIFPSLFVLPFLNIFLTLSVLPVSCILCPVVCSLSLFPTLVLCFIPLCPAPFLCYPFLMQCSLSCVTLSALPISCILYPVVLFLYASPLFCGIHSLCSAPYHISLHCALLSPLCWFPCAGFPVLVSLCWFPCAGFPVLVSLCWFP
jgi:hypothetical protein